LPSVISPANHSFDDTLRESRIRHLGELDMEEQGLEYAGFWVRTGAALIDTLLLMLITLPLLISIYGWDYFDADQSRLFAGPADFLVSWVLPAIAVITFWIMKQATPGKMAISAKIVDAESGKPARSSQLVGRYFAYFVAMLPLGLGIVWVAFDRRKQGWHDKLAGTVVVRQARRGPEPVKFGS
jgi:uncharacterized RDD family membrane protein YckC